MEYQSSRVKQIANRATSHVCSASFILFLLVSLARQSRITFRCHLNLCYRYIFCSSRLCRRMTNPVTLKSCLLWITSAWPASACEHKGSSSPTENFGVFCSLLLTEKKQLWRFGHFLLSKIHWPLCCACRCAHPSRHGCGRKVLTEWLKWGTFFTWLVWF